MFKTYFPVAVAFLATVAFLGGILIPHGLAAAVLLALWGVVVAGMISAARERRRAQAGPGIDTLTRHFRSLLDSIVDGVVVTDGSGSFQFFNPAAEKILKIGETDTGPEEWPETYGLFLPDQKTRFPHDKLPLVRAQQGEMVKEVEIFVRHDRAPQGIWLSVSAAPFKDGQDRILGAAAVFRDVTDLKRSHLRVKRARDAADAASRAKSAFLANMSHEMRTPMNAILGLTELVLDSRLTSEQREYLSLVRSSGQALLSLIDDSLDLSRIEAGKLALYPITFDLRDAVCDTVRSLAFQAHGKGLSLVCSLDPDLPAAVVGDPGRLGQVLYNLTGNAIKFTDAGEVVVRIGAEGPIGDAVTLHATVTDTGIGIPPDKLKTIFGLFEQVDPSPSRRHGGAGLGLAISARLTELLGGRIWAESRLHEGSTFHFTCRFQVAARKPPDPGPDLSGLRVLILDGNASHRGALRELLTASGMACDAPDGDPPSSAFVAEPGTGLPYDVYLMGGVFREGKELSLARDLVERRAGGRGAVILLLVAGASAGGGDRCGAVGVDACLLAPVNPTELLAAIATATGRQPHPEPDRDPAGKRHARSLDILLAEDSPVNQRLARDLLEHWGHRVTVANNGREAVAAATSRRFDLALMDVQMPEMDGLEATRMIRSQTGAAPLPIYALTAHTSRENLERYRAVGMDGQVAKPLRIEELFDLIAGVVGDGSESEQPDPSLTTRSPVS
jgi:signal transduction histidine kinase/CheY-like chemotaxis protein